MYVYMSVVRITSELIDLLSSNSVYGSLVAMALVIKVFFKIAHVQKVNTIKSFMFFRNCPKTGLTILINFAVAMPI